MKVKGAFLALVATVALASPLWAQHDHHQAGAQGAASQSSASDGKAAACHHHMSEAKETLAKLDAAVSEAQQADTSAKRQAALDQVRSLTDQLKKHISMCPMMQTEAMQEMDGMDCMRHEMHNDATKN